MVSITSFLSSSVQQEHSLLVMENLFYNVDIKNKFDLKGSERNRRVNPSNQNANEELVLMDENLLQSKYFPLCSMESFIQSIVFT